MTREDLVAKIAEALEIGSVTDDLDFRAVAGWSSLMGFGLMVFLENDCGRPVTVDEFLKLRTVGDLVRFAEEGK